jgi:hypothetical protein
MSSMPELTHVLRQLQLPGILGTLEGRNPLPIKEEMTQTDFIGLILEDDIARREPRTVDPAPPQEDRLPQPDYPGRVRFFCVGFELP